MASAKPAARYPLRNRGIHRGPRDGDARGASGSGGDEEALATLFVGLQPKAMTKQERQAFGNRMAEYLEARCVWGARERARHLQSVCCCLPQLPLIAATRHARRSTLLLKWYRDCTRLVRLEECTGE